MIHSFHMTQSWHYQLWGMSTAFTHGIAAKSPINNPHLCLFALEKCIYRNSIQWVKHFHAYLTLPTMQPGWINLSLRAVYTIRKQQLEKKRRNPQRERSMPQRRESISINIMFIASLHPIINCLPRWDSQMHVKKFTKNLSIHKLID